MENSDEREGVFTEKSYIGSRLTATSLKVLTSVIHKQTANMHFNLSYSDVVGSVSQQDLGSAPSLEHFCVKDVSAARIDSVVEVYRYMLTTLSKRSYAKYWFTCLYREKYLC